MAKINLDKYYTPSDLAEYCVKKKKELIREYFLYINEKYQ